ncbi:MAG TPA: hypothetical protein VGY54_13300 [Polyangiaceae bacterium]|jgi:hypothetical protein|nr:hypothetical protein [Polyangiaceae bacterium]
MATSSDEWALYADHRAHFTEALLSSVLRQGGRICLLGAGNCNDVDLERLAATFSEIHLVDIDSAALARAAARQPPSVRALLHRHAPVDLSGLSKRLKKWKAAAPTLAGVEASAASAVRSIVASLSGPFDVVASACVLTQMSFHLRDVLGESHPMLAALRISLVATHLGTLAGLTKVGGVSLLASDLTSSNFYPVGELSPDGDLRDAMNKIVETGRFYHAANPHLIRDVLARYEGERVGEPEWLDPWIWTGAHSRTYLVYALRFQRIV